MANLATRPFSSSFSCLFTSLSLSLSLVLRARSQIFVSTSSSSPTAAFPTSLSVSDCIQPRAPGLLGAAVIELLFASPRHRWPVRRRNNSHDSSRNPPHLWQQWPSGHHHLTPHTSFFDLKFWQPWSFDRRMITSPMGTVAKPPHPLSLSHTHVHSLRSFPAVSLARGVSAHVYLSGLWRGLARPPIYPVLTGTSLISLHLQGVAPRG